MTVFMTGASGHLGLTLVHRLLDDGRHVRTLTRYRTPYLANLPIEFVEGDLGHEPSLHRAFDGVDVVYHTAALISLDPYTWSAMHAINVEGTCTIVSLCQQHQVRRLIHVSSLEVFRTNPLTQPLGETRALIAEDCPQPYPRSKVLGQRVVQHATRRLRVGGGATARTTCSGWTRSRCGPCLQRAVRAQAGYP